MSPELLTKLIADAPILAVLLLVLWRGGEKLDKLGEKIDKVTNAVKNLGAKVELIGKLQDVRLDLHEERTTGSHAAVTASAASTILRGQNGTNAPRLPHPSWPGPTSDEDEG